MEKKKSLKKNYQSKAKEVSSEGSSDSSDGEVDEEDEMKPRKKIVSKGKVQNNEGLKKRKRPEKETKASIKKKTKAVKIVSEDNNDAESGSVSDDGHSQSSSEKPIKVFLFICPRFHQNLKPDQIQSYILLWDAEKGSFNSSLWQTRGTSENSYKIVRDEVLFQLTILEL